MSLPETEMMVKIVRNGYDRILLGDFRRNQINLTPVMQTALPMAIQELGSRSPAMERKQEQVFSGRSNRLPVAVEGATLKALRSCTPTMRRICV